MYFKQILNERCGCASYVVACSNKEAAIIDPAIDIEDYIELIDERELKLKYVIDTHVHADHISGARKLQATYGAELCMFENAKVTFSFKPVSDGEELLLGNLILRAMHTPGHRPELMSLLIINPERSPEPSMVLTGDSLLVGDVGRPDFGGGNAADQFQSLTRLMGLEDWVAVFPGHFEGPCGKGMCGRPSTTIGFERRYNPLASLKEIDFIGFVESEVPARPLNMTMIEATNRGVQDATWAMLTSSARIPSRTPEEVAGTLESGLLIDVREPDELEFGYVPGSLNIPQCDIASRLGDLPKDRPIYVICHAGLRSQRAAQFLRQIGYENVSTVRGGVQAWQALGLPIVGCKAATGDVARTTESEWSHAGGPAPNFEPDRF